LAQIRLYTVGEVHPIQLPLLTLIEPPQFDARDSVMSGGPEARLWTGTPHDSEGRRIGRNFVNLVSVLFISSLTVRRYSFSFRAPDAGEMLFLRPRFQRPPTRVMHWPELELSRSGASPRIADSEHVLLLFEPGHYPMAYFPESDIAPNTLDRIERATRHRDLGLNIVVHGGRGRSERVPRRMAAQHIELPNYASELQGRIAFAWPAMDAFLRRRRTDRGPCR
jgi:hypothetical protein